MPPVLAPCQGRGRGSGVWQASSSGPVGLRPPVAARPCRATGSAGERQSAEGFWDTCYAVPHLTADKLPLALQDLSRQVQSSANRALLAVDWPPAAADAHAAGHHRHGKHAPHRPDRLTNGDATGTALDGSQAGKNPTWGQHIITEGEHHVV